MLSPRMILGPMNMIRGDEGLVAQQRVLVEVAVLSSLVWKGFCRRKR